MEVPTQEGLERYTVNTLRKLYCDYYSKMSLLLPHDVRLREFAAQLWGARSYVRHMAFSSPDYVHQYVKSKGPRHFYYSSAKYLNPSASDMELKEWIGADLIFDIDADHIPQCRDGKVVIEDNERSLRVVFVDESCIKHAAEETLNLIEALEYELGFDSRKIKVMFSGHRGFHVLVELSEEDLWLKAEQDVRRELIKYLRAEGASVDKLRPKPVVAGRRRRGVRELLPTTRAAGLRGRLARVLARIARARGCRDLAEALTQEHPFPLTKFAHCNVEELLEEALQRISIHIDEQVTVDVRRLVRVPMSLNGKTSLPALPVHPDELLSFELVDELSPFKGLDKLVVVYKTDLPSITVLGEKLSKAKRGERRRLPAPLALYLVSKDVAYLAPR